MSPTITPSAPIAPATGFDPFQTLSRATRRAVDTMPVVVLDGTSRGLPEADWPIIVRAGDLADLLVSSHTTRRPGGSA